MSMERLRQVFMLECQGSLQQIEDALLHLEANPHDTEAVHLLFRATHTIKGSADLVEFTIIAEFAHVMENVLDEVRSGHLTVNEDFINVMLASRDHINTLLEHSLEGTVDETLQQAEKKLLERLHNYLDKANLKESKSTTAVWHISLRFSEDALRNGVEPSALLTYLTNFGTIITLTTSFDTLPSAAHMVPENCYLGFDIEFNSQIDRNAIGNIFELVHEHCRVQIWPSLHVAETVPQESKVLEEVLVKKSPQLQSSKAAISPAQKYTVHSQLNDYTTVQSNEVTLDKPPAENKKKFITHKTLYVDADKLDQLIDLVGELVIATASVNLQVATHANEVLKEAAITMSRLVEDIRDRALSMRMVHIHDTFNRFPRMVHDHCRELDKKVDLIINGADTELDKSMVEKIAEPLMHLVRNAIVHGIESPAERLAQGKPETGTVRLNAYHNSGNIIIEVSDDGRGLDQEKISAIALKKGFIKAPKNLSEAEISRLIFEPGFSTSEQITQLSGRGVGLDSVKRSISAQNGWVNVKSKLGFGTTVQISLPLTLAIIDGFLLGVGDCVYVIPLDHVIECVEFPRDVHYYGNYINLRDHLLPLLPLRKLFGVNKETKEPQREHIVVVNYGGCQECQAGLIVNELLGEFQAVIKPLGKIFEKLAGISGATILGNGEVALILDVPALVQCYGVEDNSYPQSTQKNNSAFNKLQHSIPNLIDILR